MDYREFLKAFIAHCNAEGCGSAYSQEEAIDGFLAQWQTNLKAFDFHDWFYLMQPYFDIRLVPEVGIVTGKYFHTVLDKPR